MTRSPEGGREGDFERENELFDVKLSEAEIGMLVSSLTYMVEATERAIQDNLRAAADRIISAADAQKFKNDAEESIRQIKTLRRKIGEAPGDPTVVKHLGTDR